jgi:excinuclease ABC subunit C
MKAQQIAKNLPGRPGVYIFKNAKNQPIYVGKAVDLKSRVASYFRGDLLRGPNTSRMISLIVDLEYVETESEIEALLLESEFIKRLKPKYNVLMKDDKAYKYIKITWNEEFPRVLTSRSLKKDGAKYFGPFPEGGTVNGLLRDVRRMFPYCNEKKKTGKPCFYVHLGLCPGVCGGGISKEEYRAQIRRLVLFLSGKKQRVVKELSAEMKSLAKENKFEEASQIRDMLSRIDYVTQRFSPVKEYLENPNLLRDLREREVNDLIEVLKTHQVLPEGWSVGKEFRVEAYDMSNISGQLAVGSRITFINGEPDKSQYRRFKIKKEKSQGDTDFMREVLERRIYKSQKDSKKKAPDLMVLDGGIAQLNTVLSVLSDAGIIIPTIALSKRWETIIFPDSSSLRLPKDSPALHLLQRMRDEAHRFAKAYHLKLRQKNSGAKL